MVFDAKVQRAGALPSSKKDGGWKAALRRFLRPELTRAEASRVLWSDDRVVLVYDAFPKGRVHLLLLARDPSVERGVSSLRPRHLPLLEHLYVVSRAIVAELERRGVGGSYPYRTGFHAVPSLDVLHLHILSEDFNFTCLKKKRHWNSFTKPEYFVSPDWVLQHMRASGTLPPSLRAEAKAVIKSDMQCHLCQERVNNIQSLRKHLKSC